ncbi:MAG: hypothetical protein K6A77_02710 [Clostridiales bacterium]|nr:hypothetical protein [Clostridiales bacterium]
MAKYSEKLDSKLFKAKSQDEIAVILDAAGKDTARAEQIWDEIQGRGKDRELDLDELDAVSGGADRDWLTDGCAASVEPGSFCNTNDACWHFSVTYDHEPVEGPCPVCGGMMYYYKTEYATRPSDDVDYFKCRSCGYLQVC